VRDAEEMAGHERQATETNSNVSAHRNIVGLNSFMSELTLRGLASEFAYSWRNRWCRQFATAARRLVRAGT
jgi:hypothetical protein